MGRKSTKVKVICQYSECGKEFYTIPMYLRTGRGKYCNRVCYAAARFGVKRGPLNWSGVREERICEACKKVFEVGFGTGKPLDQKLCSSRCQRLSRYRHGAQANELSLADAAYLAGFVDGEGSIMLTPRRDKVAVKFSISNTNKAILDWVAVVTGVGAVQDHRSGDGTNKACFQYQANSEAAESIIQQIEPYLIVKKEQAKLALETQERLRNPALNADRDWQQEYITQMKAMNKRGPNLTLTAGS